MEAGLGLEAMGIEGEYGDFRKPRFVQCFVQESDIVRRTAHAACLGQHDRRLGKIICPRCKGTHERADGDDRRIAGVIIHAGEPLVDILMDRRNDLDVVAFPLDCGFDDGEMNG